MNRSPQEMMQLAWEVASLGPSEDLPIAAVISDSSGGIVASSRNALIERGQATAHAELLAIGGVDLETLKRDGKNMTIAVTLEPCPMCAWAIRVSGIGRLIFGAYNPQYGAAGSAYDLLRDRGRPPIVEVIGGVFEHECRQLLHEAFSDIRDNRVR